MYFVAMGESGEHAFAVTPEEQQANIDKYLNTPDGGQ
jgi:cell division protein YceG involved in septum cleavage